MRFKIKEAAWSYREGSKIILTFLDLNNNQTGAGFRVCGIFRTNNDMFEGMSVFVPAGELSSSDRNERRHLAQAYCQA